MSSKKRVNLGDNITNTHVASHDNQNLIQLNYLIKSNMSDTRPYLDVRIFGRSFRALLDSGASNTVLGRDGMWLMDKFPIRMRHTTGRCVETADGKKHQVLGYVNLPITLEGRTRNLEVVVVPSLTHILILGIDFWDTMQIVTDIHNRIWEFAPNNGRIGAIVVQEGIQSEEHLNSSQRERLEIFMSEQFPERMEPKALGRTTLVEHVIDTSTAVPIKQRYYAMSPALLKIVYEELDKMLELGVVTPSKSAWSSPIVMVDKPDGSRRFCVDFRKVNEVTRRDAYPLPQVTTILDRLRDARYLSSLDVKSAYWQIPLSKESREKTAFTIPGRGLYEFVTMPYGLHNAPATWQRFIDRVLGADLEPHVFVYLDDVIIITQTFEKHLEVLKEVLHRLSRANITLNRDKCNFCRPQLRYLGYVVDNRGLRVDPEKVEAILKIPVPTSQKTVRQFCGTASWYRRFIPDFATRMYPLTDLLRRRKKFGWTDEAQKAFEDIRSCLIKAPILACPDFELPFIVSCDASGVGVGAVLSQKTAQGEQVIAYASRTLTKAEQKYSATERECIAVIWAVERFRPYIEGTHFTIITDHYSLLWLHNLKDPQGRLARWALRLQPYSFDLIHRKGKEHVVPDILSRSVEEEVGDIQVNVLQEEKKEDKWYTKMLKDVQENEDKFPSWKVEGGVLWKHVPNQNFQDEERFNWKEVLPKYSRSEILHKCHDVETAGHLGSYKTCARVQTRYYWPKMRQDVAKYVRRCKVCQQTKSDQQKPSGLAGAYRGVDRPFVMLSADLMGPFPRSSSGHKYILVVMDTFTKMPLLFPMREATASAVAKRLEEDVFLMFGIPSYIICDNGSEFTGNKFKQLAEGYKVKLLYNASRHPQANPTERLNRTIGPMLRAYVGENHRHWDQALPKIAFALRTAKSEVTGYSPAFLNFGRELFAIQDDASLHNKPDEVPEVEDAASYGSKIKDLDKVYHQVAGKLRKAHSKNVQRYNLRRRSVEFSEGSQVWKRNFQQSDAINYFSAKLAPKYMGPFTVSKKVSPVIYKLVDDTGKDVGTWHVSDLKPYV